MAESNELIYRVLYEINGLWRIKKTMSLKEAKDWAETHYGGILIRYAVNTLGGNRTFESKEEAEEYARENGGQATAVKPPQAIFEKLSNEAIALYYIGENPEK